MSGFVSLRIVNHVEISIRQKHSFRLLLIYVFMAPFSLIERNVSKDFRMFKRIGFANRQFSVVFHLCVLHIDLNAVFFVHFHCS